VDIQAFAMQDESTLAQDQVVMDVDDVTDETVPGEVSANEILQVTEDDEEKQANENQSNGHLDVEKDLKDEQSPTSVSTVSNGDILGATESIQGVLTYSINVNEVSILKCDVNATDDEVASSITAIEAEGYSITAIGYDAFKDCSKITQFPKLENLRLIESCAFWNTAIRSITLPKYLQVTNMYNGGPFANIPTLTEVTFEDGTTVVPAYVLYGAKSVTKVNLPDEVSLIERYAFAETQLASIELSENLKEIGDYAFWSSGLQSISLPDSLEKIGTSAFENVGGITELVLPEKLRTIGANAFSGTSITSIILPIFLESCENLYYLSAENNDGPFSHITTLKEAKFADGTIVVAQNVLRGADSLTSIELPEGITQIGDYAFAGTGIRSITLPSTLKTIGEGSFRDCSIRSLIMPDRVESIGINAFYNANGLSEVVLSKKLKTIDTGAFRRTSLKSVLLPATMITGQIWGSEGTFSNIPTLEKIEFADGLKVVPSYLLNNLDKAIEIVLPESVTIIGDYAFHNSKIQSIHLPSSLESIKNSAFYGTDLRSITIPDTVVSVEGYAFCDAANLSEVTFSSNLKYIGEKAFNGTDLSSIELPASLESCNAESYSTTYRDGPFANITTLTSVIFADGMVTIPQNVLSGAKRLTKIQIPDTVLGIGDYAFAFTNITSIDLPSNLETIGDGAFTGSQLFSITLPDRVTKIGNEAFRNAVDLSEVELSDSLQSIGSLAFSNSALSKVTLPASLKSCDYDYYDYDYETIVGPFYDIPTLTEVVFADGTTTVASNVLRNTQNVMDIYIPEGTLSIGEYAFAGISLESIKLPMTLVTIGNSVFENSKLRSIDLPDAVEEIGESAFANTEIQSITWSCSLNVIGDNAFKKVRFQSVELPNTVESIGRSAFQGASNLTNVHLSKSLKSIGEKAFWGTALSSVALPASLEYCGYGMENNEGGGPFAQIPSLNEATFAEGTINVAKNVLNNAKSITSIILPEGVAVIGWEAFRGTSIESITLPESLVNIGTGVFRQTNLHSVTLPDAVEDLGEDVFKDASKLSDVTLSNSLRAIGGNAFSGTNITQILIPASLKIVSFSNPFSGISTLRRITFAPGPESLVTFVLQSLNQITEVNLPETLKSIRHDTFIGLDSLTELYIPKSVEFIEESAFRNMPSDFTIIGELESYAELYAITNNIPFKCIYENFVTINTDETTNISDIPIYGAAPYGKKITIYDGNTLIGTFQSKKNHRYSGNVTLSGSFGTHTLKAVSTDENGNEIAAETIVQYTDNSPRLKEFMMYHNGSAINLMTNEGIRQILSFSPGQPFSFKVKMDNADQINHLLICSERDGTIKVLKAAYDKGSDLFIASGFFDEDQDYVPGTLSVRTTRKIGVTDEELEMSFDEFEIDYDMLREGLPTDWRNVTTTVIEEKPYRTVLESHLNDGTDDTITTVVTQERIPLTGFDDIDILASRMGYIKYHLIFSTFYYKATYADNRIVFSSLNSVNDVIDGSYVLVSTIECTTTAEKLPNPVITKAMYDSMGTWGAIAEAAENNVDMSALKKKLDQAVQSGKMAKSYAERYLTYQLLIQTCSLTGKIALTIMAADIPISQTLREAIEYMIYAAFLSETLTIKTKFAEEEEEIEKGDTTIINIYPCYAISIGTYIIIIDPSGYLYEVVPEDRIEDATVTVYYQGDDGEAIQWDAEEFEQGNPLKSDGNGRYYWNVPEGLWQVKAEKEGYETVYSEWMPVPPEQTEVNLAMVSTSRPNLQFFHVYGDKLTVVFDRYIKADSMTSDRIAISTVGKGVNIHYIEPKESVYYNDEYVAKEFDIYLTEPISGINDYTISVSDAIVGYNGKSANNSSMSGKLKSLVSGITTPDSIQMNYGSEYSLTATVVPSTNVTAYTVTATSNLNDIVTVKSVSPISEDGKVKIVLKGEFVGEAQLHLLVNGTQIQKSIPITVAYVPQEEPEPEPEPVKLGDVDDDGSINIFDIMAIRDQIFGAKELDDNAKKRADTTGDGIINIFDIMAIRDHIFGTALLA
jgi:hypothetical protein